MLKVKRILAVALVLTMVCANLPWTAAATALTQDGEEVVLTETILPEDLVVEEVIVTDTPAATGTGSPSGDYVERISFEIPEFKLGDPLPEPEQIDVLAEGCKVKEVYGCLPTDDGQEETFLEYKTYSIRMIVEPLDGMTFSYDTEIEYDGRSWFFFPHDDFTEMYVELEFDFIPPHVEYIDIQDLFFDIQPGAATVPELTVDGNATMVSARWLDADKQPVDTLEVGYNYWLELTFAPDEGYCFTWNTGINPDQYFDYDYDIPDFNTLVFTRCYSLMPDVGSVKLNTSGVAEGAPISGVKAEASGNARVQSFEIWNITDDVDVSSGVFEHGKCYRLSITLWADEPYRFTYDTDIDVNNGDSFSWYLGSSEVAPTWAVVELEYNFQAPEVGWLDVYGRPDSIEAGTAQIPDLTVDGNAKVTDVRWLDTQDRTVTKFTTGNIYWLAVTFKAEDGFIFYNFIDTYCHDYEIISETEAVVYWKYSLLPDAGRVDVTISGIEPGASVSGVFVDVSGNANFEEYYITSSESDDDVTSGNFEDNAFYQIGILLYPAEGYRFTEKNRPYVNGTQDYGWYDAYDGSYIWVYVGYEFRDPAVEDIYIEGLPEDGAIVPGAAQIPEMYVLEGGANLTGARWLDLNKQPVTTLVQGQAYFLELTLEAQEGYAFRDWFNLMNDRSEHSEYEIIDKTEAVYYCYYTLVPAVSEIHVTATGYGEGKPVSGVTAAVTGNAVLDRIEIYNVITEEFVESGKFESGMVYCIHVFLNPAQGYRFSDDTRVWLNNGEDVGWGYSEHEIETRFYLSTCEEINTVALNIGTVEVGKKVSDAKVTAPTKANYEVKDYSWIDITDGHETAAGNFQKGHKYYVMFELTSKDGYTFAKNVKVTLGGKDVQYMSADETGLYFYGEQKYSFLEKITKVELPAMPSSIKKGSALPADFKVSSSAKYTLEPVWGIMNEGEATKADKNASYVLMFYVYPKAGYEFTKDTVVYVGGNKCTNLNLYEDHIQVIKAYNVGVTEIERIDLTVPVPEAGAKPGQITIAANGAYGVLDYYWATNASGNIRDDYENIEQFKDGQIVMLSYALQADSGYGFANDLDVYVNGKKLTQIAMNNYGSVIVGAVNLGKLGEVDPMAAPKISVEKLDSQNTLTWAGDPNATGYEIYRATSKSGKYTLVDTAADTSWQDTSATAGKTYYYKIKAVNSGNPDFNSGYSNVVSMAAVCATPELEVVAGSTGKPVLTWNKITGAKKYEIWRSVDGAAFKKLTTVTKTTYTDTKATEGAECAYKVKALASSSKYNGNFSAERSCYVTCAAPSLTAKVDTATGKPSLSWGKITGATGYAIYRAVNGGAFAHLETITTTTYQDKATKADNQYSYKVVTLGKAEVFNSAESAVKTVTVTVGQPKLTGTINDNGKPVITWEAVEDAVAYKIYRATSSSASKFKTPIATITDLTYVDTSVAAGKTYYYKVVAVGQNSESAMSAYVKLTGKCDIPALSVVAGSTGKPVLTWNKISGAKKYEIWRSVDGAAFKKLTTTTKTTYTDTKATEGAECVYKVKALASSSKNNGLFSSEHGCYVICAAPSLTVKIDTATGKPSLSWKKITGATGYAIYRAVNDGAFEYVETVTGVSYTDIFTVADQKYSYKVVSVGKSEVFNSLESAVKTVTATCGQPKLTGTVNDSGKPVITWEAVDDAVAYKIYRATSSSAGKFKTPIATVTDLTYVDTSVTAGKTYYYKVVAVSADGQGVMSSYVKLTGKCDQPVASAALNAKSGKPVITWEKISGAKKYEVYRATSENGKYSKIGTSTKTSYTDTKASVGTTYYYKVVAAGSKSSYNSIQSVATEPVTTLLAQPTVTLKNDSKTGMPVVSWKKVSGASQYIVMYVDVTDFMESETGPDEAYMQEHMQYVTTTKTSVTLTDTEIGQVYMVTMTAVPSNEEYFSVPTDPQLVVSACATPKITGFIDEDYGKPGAYWNEVDGAEGYIVYRSTKSGSGYKALGVVFDEYFIDGSAVKGKTYYYKVTAATEYSESDLSNSVKLKSK